MPNKFCYFGCNKFKKLSVFSIPKDDILKNEWSKALSVDQLHSNYVICEKHFTVDQIKKKNVITDGLGNVLYSSQLLRHRLQPNAVPSLHASQNQLNGNFVNMEIFKIFPGNSLINENMPSSSKDYVKKLSYDKTELLHYDIQDSNIQLEHNYSSFGNDSTIANDIIINNTDNKSTTKSNFIKSVQQIIPTSCSKQYGTERLLFEKLITLKLNLPPNWHTYLSHSKKLFGVSEIVFIHKRDVINSFIRKSITIDQDLKIFCNILGKNLSSEHFINPFNKLESQEHLTTIINELVLVRICKGLDLLYSNKYESLFSNKDNIIVDTMLIKRHLNCPIIISNGYHCLYCKRAKKYLKRRKAQSLKNSSKKSAKN